MAVNVEKTEVMPDLTWPRHGFHHTVDSALVNLTQLGVSTDRITVHKAGQGWQPLRVVEQHPAPGQPLTPNVWVELKVEGAGAFFHLPVGMREASEDGHIGTQELVSIFDDAIEKAAVYVRLGGLFFDVRPNHLAGCARWIELFGIDPQTWPRERWYSLAILLPCLRYLAGRERGLRLALRLLLDLEVSAIHWRPRRTMMAEEERSLLGERAGRLGVDLILGDGLDDEASLEITLGPISLAEYRRHQTEEGQQRINQVMRFVAPYHWICEIKWLVGDANRAPRLGVEIENAVLGVNSHLGLR